MITATDLKNGTTFLFEGRPSQVVKYDHKKVGRGGATIRVQMRNLTTGDLLEKTFSSTNKFDEITTQRRKMQYLYNDGTAASFMDPNTYEQVEIPMDVLGDSVLYIKEGSNVDVMFWDETALSIEIAPKVTLEVVESDPGVKGNSAANIYKAAKMDNGLETKVPLFIKVGDKVRIDTRTGEYVERVND